MIRVSSDQILYRLPPNDAFWSFHTGFQENKAILDRQLRSAMEANNPALAAQELIGVKALWNALEMHLGKGPTACAVFNDGHSACFQINMLYPGALAYIDGTHRDAAGTVVRESGGVPNRGGSGVEVDRTKVDSVRYTSFVRTTPRQWLVCGYVGGKLVNRYILIE